MTNRLPITGGLDSVHDNQIMGNCGAAALRRSADGFSQRLYKQAHPLSGIDLISMSRQHPHVSISSDHTDGTDWNELERMSSSPNSGYCQAEGNSGKGPPTRMSLLPASMQGLYRLDKGERMSLNIVIKLIDAIEIGHCLSKDFQRTD